MMPALPADDGTLAMLLAKVERARGLQLEA